MARKKHLKRSMPDSGQSVCGQYTGTEFMVEQVDETDCRRCLAIHEQYQVMHCGTYGVAHKMDFTEHPAETI